MCKVIVLNLIDYCGFNCEYCTSSQVKKVNSNPLTKLNFLMLIKQIEKSLSRFIIKVTGGEPTLHPNFLEFIEKLNNVKNIQRVIITTNGSCNNLEKLNNYKKVHTIISYHPNQIDEDSFINIINKQTIKQLYVALPVLGYPTKIIDFLSTNNYHFFLIFLTDKKGLKVPVAEKCFNFFEQIFLNNKNILTNRFNLTRDEQYFNIFKNNLNKSLGCLCNPKLIYYDNGIFTSKCRNLKSNKLETMFSVDINCKKIACEDYEIMEYRK
ncbi:radical SAM protein [Campylobacter coli]|nr:radical SAM protein [Campylobacter coli]